MFFCKKCCVRYPVFWEVESEKAEKMVCRCDKCQDLVIESENRLREAMATEDFRTLDKVCRQILAVEIEPAKEKMMRDALVKDKDGKYLKDEMTVIETFRQVFKKDEIDAASWVNFEKAANERNREAIDELVDYILNDKVDIDVKLKCEAQKLHLRLEKELEIRTLIDQLKHNDVYKTIRKSVKILTEKQEQAEALGVNLDPMLVHDINQCVARLFSERDLRYQMDNTVFEACDPGTVETLEKLIDKAAETKVEDEYLNSANKLKTKMQGNIQAREILQMLVDYPQREYPEPD